MLRIIKLVSISVLSGLLIAAALVALRYVWPVYTVKKGVAAHFAGADLEYHEVFVNPEKGLSCGIVNVVQPNQQAGQVNFFFRKQNGQLSFVASTGFNADQNSLKEAQQSQYDNVKFWDEIEACFEDSGLAKDNII